MNAETIAKYVAIATGIAGTLGALGHGLVAIPWKPAQYVGGILVAVYSNFRHVIDAVTGKSLPQKDVQK